MISVLLMLVESISLLVSDFVFAATLPKHKNHAILLIDTIALPLDQHAVHCTDQVKRNATI